MPADFEAPADSNRDNVYQIELSVSDGKGSVTQAFTVTVTNVSEGAFRVRRVATNLDRRCSWRRCRMEVGGCSWSNWSAASAS